MTTFRNAPVWWRVAFGVIAATALVWSVVYPEALVWAVAALYAGWQVQAAEQREAAWSAALDKALDDLDAAEHAAAVWRGTATALSKPRTSELRRRLEARPSAPVVNLYPRLPRDGGEAS